MQKFCVSSCLVKLPTGVRRKRGSNSRWTTDSDVAVRLRALRKLADETKNHDLERDFYIEELKAEIRTAPAALGQGKDGRRASGLCFCSVAAVTLVGLSNVLWCCINALKIKR
jgi:hypothetical protein